MNMRVKAKAELKAGDRVRVTHTDFSDALPVGSIAIVQRIDEDGDVWLKAPASYDDEGLFFFRWEFELAPKFAVGDKVRFTDKCAAFWWFGPHTAHKEGVVSSTEGGSYQYKVEVDGEGWPASVDAEHIELVAVAPATSTAATLTIRAGRFYQTRDGRKVGPMEVTRYASGSGNPSWPFTIGLTEFWTEEGKAYWGNVGGQTSSEIIAEWPVEKVEVVAEATTAKFKVGDRVKFRDDYGSSARGKEATVIKVYDWGIQVDQGGGDDWHDVSTESPSSLVLLPATPTSIADIVRKHSGTAVVMLIENGQPKPSTLPYVHYDRASAAKEASRLAGIHKGGEFGVYECVDVIKDLPAKVYDHEWQRLAKSGPIIPAIKELRRFSGIGLKAAKDSVENWLQYN